ncbi:hypothetical protein [Nguyenibacter vanlangensis]|uniref:hypothetical protein n=1 Tax=Nguyenibacter vanlangensis TaxID=1216886 RepID=UPI0038D0AC21
MGKELDDIGLEKANDAFSHGIFIGIADAADRGSAFSFGQSLGVSDRGIWADSTGRCNTFDHILFELLVERFRGHSPFECYSWPCTESMGNNAQFLDAMLAKIDTFERVLAGQAVGIVRL